MDWSVVIPAHNEAANLEACVAQFIQSLPSDVVEVLMEIVIVENGSTDGTLEACHRAQQRFPKLIRVCAIPRGSYGEAIKKGMLESRGTHISILECDFLDPGFVSASLAIFRANRAQFVVGSKRHPQSVDRRPLKRRILTLLYNYVFLRLLIGYSGSDTHGLKSIETPVAKRLCEIAITTDEVFQTEIVLLAWRLGIKIEEIPIKILEIRNPSVTVFRRIPKVLKTVRDLQGSLVRFPKPSTQLPSQS
ncbi:MAG TPA: glycosyltransferase family 2 protein [Terriglobales bacterium]|jgi:glycosyltransferase involved in cell wall biosynthesis|nr:glycosyltransferase family 2 protein [Terriglobales bacterium]